MQTVQMPTVLLSFSEGVQQSIVNNRQLPVFGPPKSTIQVSILYYFGGPKNNDCQLLATLCQTPFKAFVIHCNVNPLYLCGKIGGTAIERVPFLLLYSSLHVPKLEFLLILEKKYLKIIRTITMKINKLYRLYGPKYINKIVWIHFNYTSLGKNL